MSLFSKKTKEETKEVNEEPRDNYIELGTTAHISDGTKITITHNVYGATFDEMLARVGGITSDKENGNAFIVQQFMTLKEHNEMIDSNRRKKHLDN